MNVNRLLLRHHLTILLEMNRATTIEADRMRKLVSRIDTKNFHTEADGIDHVRHLHNVRDAPSVTAARKVDLERPAANKVEKVIAQLLFQVLVGRSSRQ